MKELLEVSIDNLNMDINITWYEQLKRIIHSWQWEQIVLICSILLSATGILWTFTHNAIIAYGDAGAHINIAKRVVSGLTPGFAQLGGVWLPLPHMLMLPFVWSDFMWRTGLAGSFVSGTMYVIAGYTLFKLIYLLTKSKVVSFLTFLLFALNPNILYLQSTPMTELPLFTFFLLTTYFFIKYLKNPADYIALLFAALFTCCATLSRYDGWFLVPTEIIILFLQYAFRKATWRKTEARIVLFGILAGFGILLWLAWGAIILHDPLYFMNSPFSAKSQQSGWQASGQLPTYKHLFLSIWYYSVAVVANTGVITSFLAFCGLIVLLWSKEDKNRFFYLILLFVPFLFNIYALYAGQSILFIPGIEPVHYLRPLFNARYGSLMISVLAILVGYLLYKIHWVGKLLVIGLLIIQLGLFYTGRAEVITYTDAIYGQSAGIKPGSTIWVWINNHYDGGKVLLDDYTTIFNVAKTNIAMQDVISIGEKPYWEKAFQHPEKYTKWIIVEPGDAVDKGLANYTSQKLLRHYFTIAYSANSFSIYKCNDK